ncbi:MAG: Txe/YoeB family addiction module toxin [Bacteroidales bacterium]|nr:Txe/YoeB family addiction module toxin [Bacteroidales bacterium]
MYVLNFTTEADDDLKKLKKSEPQAAKKALELLNEIMETPYTGRGKPHPLTGDRAGQWSRRITQKHRLVYTVNDNEITILVLAAYGHYDDK